MAKKPAADPQAIPDFGYDIAGEQEAAQTYYKNPRSMLPPIAEERPRTSDILRAALMGFAGSNKAALEASSLGDPLTAALAAIGGAAGAPTPQMVQMQRLESTPLGDDSPIVQKHPEFKGMTLGMIQKLGPYIQRNEALEQRMALFEAAEAGRNKRAEEAANRPQIFFNPTTGEQVTAPKGAKVLPDRRPTQGEYTVRGFADRAKSAEGELASLMASGYNPAAIVTTRGEMVPNMIKTEDDQAAEQVMRNFVSAVLRRESGAAIPVTEMQSEILKYFPMPGDKPKVLKQKAEARRLAISSLEAEASRVPSNVASATKDKAPSGEVRRQVQTQQGVKTGVWSAQGKFLRYE